MKKIPIAILGAGSWGTAIAIHLARGGNQVLLWGHNPEIMQKMEEERQNARYLPGIEFPTHLTATSDFDAVVSEATHLIVAVPSHAFAEILNRLPKPKNGLAWITKGIDPLSHKLLSDLVEEKWGVSYPFAIISGPSFAKEVAQNLPTALTLASNDSTLQDNLRELFHHSQIRVYSTKDSIGVQLCGAVKNVLAIACGLSDGLGFGANAKAALITRGLAEMTRLGLKMGANEETFRGLAGVGDLVLTCTDNQSRNRRYGLYIGEGMTALDAETKINQVVEGKFNAAQVCYLAEQLKVEMPICTQINLLLKGKVNAKEVVTNLMNRSPKDE